MLWAHLNQAIADTLPIGSRGLKRTTEVESGALDNGDYSRSDDMKNKKIDNDQGVTVILMKFSQVQI